MKIKDLNPFKKKTSDLENQIKDLQNEFDKLADEKEFNEQIAIIEEKAVSTDGAAPLGGFFNVVDEQVNKMFLQRLYCTETWFFIAVHTIAKTIGALPVKLDKRFFKKEEIENPDGSKGTVSKEVWVDASGEPEMNVMRFPNSIMTGIEFWMLIVMDLLATGEAFIWCDQAGSDLSDGSSQRLQEAMDRIRKTNVKNMFRLNSALVEAVIDEENHNKFIRGYKMINDEADIEFPAEEVIHIKLPNPCDPLVGHSPIVGVIKNILLDRYAMEHMLRFYKQGARLGGVIQAKRKLTREQVNRLEKSFSAQFTGKRNHHKTLILPDGMEYKEMEQNPGQTSLIDFLKNNKEPILSAFNVPPIKVGLLDGATFSNALIQNTTYYIDTIMPIVAIIAAAINKSPIVLKKERNLRMGFSFDDIEALKEDLVKLGAIANAMKGTGASIDEIREKIWKLPPLEDGSGKIVPAVAQANRSASPFQLAAGRGQEKIDTANAQNDMANNDVVETDTGFDDRVIELVGEAAVQGVALHIAIPRAIQQAQEEGLSPAENDDGEKRSKGPHVHKDSTDRDTGGKVVMGESHFHWVFDESGNRLGRTSLANDSDDHTHQDRVNGGQTGGPISAGSDEMDDGEKVFSCGMTEKELVSYWKLVSGEGVEDMIEERAVETAAFFKRFEKWILRNLEASTGKGLGAWWRDGGKTKDILPDQDDLKAFQIKELAGFASTAMIRAARHGYKNSTVPKEIPYPNEDALKALKKIAAKNVVSITENRLDQLKNVITSSVAESVSVTELESRIKDVFGEFANAKTIARTETLTGVSIGQQLKRNEFKAQFPDEAENLKKMWLDSRDSKVRDSHEAINEDVVGVDETFANGLKFPREPGGEAKEVINCRCTVVDFLEEDKEAIQDIVGDRSPLTQPVSEAESKLRKNLAKRSSKWRNKEIMKALGKAQLIHEKVTRKPKETVDECVQRAIPKLIDEGMKPDQAAAAAHSMCEKPPKKRCPIHS